MKVVALLLLELIACAAAEEATIGHVGAHRQLTAEVPTCERLMGLANGEGSTFATNMRSCFSADTYDASNNQWPSTVGGYIGTFSGTAATVEADAAGTFGALNQDQPYLKGTTASKVAFGEIQGAGSFCAKTRYTGLTSGTQYRILTSGTNNWLHGHWGNNAGIAYYEGWITGHANLVSPTTDWVTMCCQNAGPSCWVNGVKYTGNEVPGGVESVSINPREYWGKGEESDWGAAFIASWDNDLSDAQMEVVQHVMMSTYECPADEQLVLDPARVTSSSSWDRILDDVNFDGCIADYASTPASAIDGNLGTAWDGCCHSFPDEGHWLSYDFGAATALASYGFSTGCGECPEDFKMLGSNDGNTWTVMDHQTGQRCFHQTYSSYHIAAPVAYRYIKWTFRLVYGGNQDGVRINDVALFPFCASKPTLEPTQEPTLEPTFEPTQKPTLEPTFQPTSKPTLEPTFQPTSKPTEKPTLEPTFQPTTHASTGACFHGDGALLLESGATKKFSELSIGDVITTSNGQGIFSFSPVLSLPHENNTEAAAFLSLTTETNKKVDMTSDHFISKCDKQEVTAGELEVGDCLITVDGKETLMEISSTAKSGVFTAITQDDFIVVNGVVASPFSKDSDPGKPELDYKKYRLELQQSRERKLAVRLKKHQKRMLGRKGN